jgi:hypothetical protein
MNVTDEARAGPEEQLDDKVSERDQKVGESSIGQSSYVHSAMKLETNRHRRRSSAEKREYLQQRASVTSTTRRSALPNKRSSLVKGKKRAGDLSGNRDADDRGTDRVESLACESPTSMILGEQESELWMEVASHRSTIAHQDSSDPLSASVVPSTAEIRASGGHLGLSPETPSLPDAVQPESPLAPSSSSGNHFVTLVEAREVDDPESESQSESDVPTTTATSVVVATPVRSKVRSNVAYAVCALAIVALTVGASVGMTSRPAPAAAPPATASPSAAPTLSPVSRDFQLSLPPYTQVALEDPESPQSKAFRWVTLTLEDDLSFANSSHVRLLHQAFSLATLFYATNGESSWSITSNWLNSSVDACEWHGCNCTSGGDLQSLILPENQVNGTLPREIGLLGTVQEVDLSYNEFRGSIPTEIGLLTGLTSLALRESLFDGSLPSEIGNLTLLDTLDLEVNFLTGQLPSQLGELFNLRLLFLDSNRLSGFIPSELGRLGRLEEWIMYDCAFTGQLPTEVGRLSSLTWLELSRNEGLGGPLPSQLGLLLNLQNAILDSCSFSGTIPTELGSLTNLVEANFLNNSLDGTVPTEVCNLVSSGTTLYVDCDSVTCACGCKCSR